MSNVPPSFLPEHIEKSEYVEFGTVAGTADPRDLAPFERRDNRVPCREVESRFRSKESYQFLRSGGFLGPVSHGTKRNLFKPWQDPPEYLERDRVEAAIELIRRVAAGLPPA